ncbi:MAG TPA: hypothetical protein PJ993_00680 [Candidatus Saccharibacteria bacterium]|nr:hypothetical protein [Candidatus Saccharibacteria bacterium]HMT39441.1 hypothetical protein [Candidatus Saccharibacteria bacterium]
MNTRSLHQTTSQSAYIYSPTRHPYDIRHIVKQSKLVLQQKDFNYNLYKLTKRPVSNQALTSRTSIYHRKLSLSQ